MEHATIDITFDELITITSALSYTYDDIKRWVADADRYNEVRLKLHAQFAEHQQMDK